MIKQVQVHSPWRPSTNYWTVDLVARPDPSGAHWPGERCVMKDIQGLGAVPAAISTAPLGSVDGESFSGSHVGKRNIIFTVGFTPDWILWTPAKLRAELNSYFSPKMFITMIFVTDDFAPVQISGYVESNEPNIFSEDPENVISVVCPDPYFKTVDPVVHELSGTAAAVNAEWNVVGSDIVTSLSEAELDYPGDVETGFVVQVRGSASVGIQPDWIRAGVIDPLENFVEVGSQPLGSNMGVEIGTIVRDKHVYTLGPEPDPWTFYGSDLNNAIVTDLNDRDARWPVIGPATDGFKIVSNHHTKAGYDSTFGPDPTYELVYYPRFGSL